MIGSQPELLSRDTLAFLLSFALRQLGGSIAIGPDELMKLDKDKPTTLQCFKTEAGVLIVKAVSPDDDN